MPPRGFRSTRFRVTKRNGRWAVLMYGGTNPGLLVQTGATWREAMFTATGLMEYL